MKRITKFKKSSLKYTLQVHYKIQILYITIIIKINYIVNFCHICTEIPFFHLPIIIYDHRNINKS